MTRWIPTATQTQTPTRRRRPKPRQYRSRCQTPMQFVRRMRFHEGSQWHGVFLDAGHLLGNRESFDVHACPHCGKVEFYLTL